MSINLSNELIGSGQGENLQARQNNRFRINPPGQPAGGKRSPVGDPAGSGDTRGDDLRQDLVAACDGRPADDSGRESGHD